MIIEKYKTKNMPIIEDVKEKILQHLQLILNEGFGELVIKIQDHKIVHIQRTHSEKI